jgi:glycine/D-amino acid oxidase-like deaminating enzyme
VTSVQPYPASYYAATANDRHEYPSLRDTVSADVCVIGAGYTGISTAICLAERGYAVCVVEANRVGWGASGRNGGQMIAGISGEQRIAKHHGPGIEKLLWEMRWTGHRIIRERVARYSIECDLKSGYLDVAIKARHLRDRKRFRRMTKMGAATSSGCCPAMNARDDRSESTGRTFDHGQWPPAPVEPLPRGSKGRSLSRGETV